MGADIINASWGRNSKKDTDLLKAAIESFISGGGHFVAAAGNDGLDIDVEPVSPAGLDIPELTVVGGGWTNGLNLNSNFGYESVDIAGPFGIEAIDLDNASLSIKIGTSFAAPFIAAMLAVGEANLPELSPSEMRQRLLETGKLIPAHLNFQQRALFPA